MCRQQNYFAFTVDTPDPGKEAGHSRCCSGPCQSSSCQEPHGTWPHGQEVLGLLGVQPQCQHMLGALQLWWWQTPGATLLQLGLKERRWALMCQIISGRDGILPTSLVAPPIYMGVPDLRIHQSADRSYEWAKQIFLQI